MSHHTSRLAAVINQQASVAGIKLNSEQVDQAATYLQLLNQWGQHHNLTAVRDMVDMIPRHLLDSWSVLPYMQDDQKLLDVGSGAGLPGIPLAIANPSLRITLLDSALKRVRFMRQAVLSLGLRHVEVVHCRIEAYQERSFDWVIARACAPLARLADLCEKLCQHTPLLAMKGSGVDEELTTLPDHWRLIERNRVTLPGIDVERYLVILKPMARSACG